ncbi:MAG: FecR domain-containing protein [Bacteroidales bacterium]|nr:FecR domain-containing protein [Bacteroidales bacterium]
MKSIVTKYLEGRATKAEQKELLEWLRNKENRIVFHRFSLVWENSLDASRFPGGSKESWNQIQAQLLQKSFKGWQKSRKMNQFFKIAAIFFFVISIGSLAYFFSNAEKSVPKNYTSVMAENGQISKVELPDGSTVWLNSGSEITYSNFFASDNRNIKLSGEAYFKVTRNEDLPFVVNCEELQVKVLGTQFNVAAYPKNEFVDVVLEKGSVELLNKRVESFSCKLKPGERALFDKNDRNLTVSNVNTSKFTSWKEGIMNIYDQTLDELVKRLKTRYNQNFILDDEVKDFRYTFTIENESLNEIIKLMEKITPLKAIQKQDTILFKLDKKRESMVEDRI